MVPALIWLLLAATGPSPAEAVSPPCQAAAAAQAPAPDDGPAFWIRYEWRRDRFRYRFENPSTFNTPFTVPHFFAQSYRADSQWVIAGARYRVFDATAETEFGLAPRRVSVGDDYDTFFEPDGNVAVYGTTADISLRSFQFSQRFESRPIRGWTARVGYVYQRDQALFYPSVSTTTQSQPPSFSSFWNTARESTVSEVHQFAWGVGRRFALSRGWTLAGHVDVAPLRLARLTTILPDKYPGQDIVFVSKGVSASPAMSAAWRRSRWAVQASIDAFATWNYASSSQFHRNTIGASLRVQFTPDRRAHPAGN